MTGGLVGTVWPLLHLFALPRAEQTFENIQNIGRTSLKKRSLHCRCASVNLAASWKMLPPLKGCNVETLASPGERALLRLNMVWKQAGTNT